jgi:thiamine biosynthesis protein ThiS
VNIILNGLPRTVANPLSIEIFLKEQGIESAHVVVEINKSIVPRNEFGTHEIHQNDAIEILRFVGGG